VGDNGGSAEGRTVNSGGGVGRGDHPCKNPVIEGGKSRKRKTGSWSRNLGPTGATEVGEGEVLVRREGSGGDKSVRGE